MITRVVGEHVAELDVVVDVVELVLEVVVEKIEVGEVELVVAEVVLVNTEVVVVVGKNRAPLQSGQSRSYA